jgi:anthranilate synthase component 2
VHGKTSKIHHTGKGLFRGLNNDFEATRYHSLIVKQDTLPDQLEVTATTDDGLIMGMQHKALPLHGVQFHPESIASENGHALLQNFLNLARDFNQKRAA